MANGLIHVSESGITVRYQDGHRVCETHLGSNIEDMHEAARILVAWMELKFENVADECRRVQSADQRDAHFREIIERFCQGEL